MLTLTVNSGLPPFASGGTYRIFISPLGTSYNVLGPAGPLNAGSCSYSATATNGQATLVDSVSGTGAALALTFASPTNGTLTLTSAGASQTASFALTVCAVLDPPQLFMPTFANGQFQCYFSGQPACGYTVDASGDLANWRHLVTMALAGWTTNFADTTGGAASFYRARISSTAFAPGSLTNKTFNLTIGSGASPLATSGICQWMAGTNDSGYRVVAGPGTTNSSGTYSYAMTGPNSALIHSQDSLAGALSEQLIFTSTEAGYFYATNAAGCQAGSFTMANGPVLFLGSVAFTPDSSRANTLSFAGDGTPGSLSVTDAQGWVWTLSVPGDALFAPATITMTPFAGVDCRNSILPIKAGVQLLPDGLQFCDALTLTVTPPSSLGPYASLLIGNSDGSALNFMPGTNQGNNYSAALFHFSSAAMSDSDSETLNRLTIQAEADYAITVAAIQAFAKSSAYPPPPPDYTWQCDSSDEDAAVTEYVKQLFWQEDEFLTRLVTDARMLELLGAPESPRWNDVADQLITQEMYPKVNTLFSWYSGGYDKWNAVSAAAIYALKLDELIMGSGDDAQPDWMGEISAWGLRVYEHLFDQLCNQDLYSKSFAIVKLLKWLELLDEASTPTLPDVLNRLNKALTFKVSLDMSYTFTDWDSDGFINDEASEEAKGDVNNLQAGVDAPYPVSTNSLPIVSGSWAYDPDNCSYSLDPSQSSIWHISLGMQPCADNPQVILVLNGPDPPLETWTGCGSSSEQQSWVGLCWGLDFECHSGVQGGGGLFTYPLQDGVKEIVNDSLSGDDSNSPCSDPNQRSSGTISIIINHTPQQ